MRKFIAAVALVTVSTSAHAASFGIYGNSTTQAQTLAQGQGHTASVLGALNAGTLAGLNVLWILNGDNGGQPGALVGNADVAAFVNGGGVLLFHDRNVTDAANGLNLVGGGSISFTRSLSSDIGVENAINPIISGPGGTISNTTLDGGNYSNHGFASLGSLPGGVSAILNNGTPGNIVDFFYGFGGGKVYYSSIPFDFYLGGGGNNGDSFRNIYGPNVVAQAASLAGDVNGAVPEPGTWALMIAGFGLVGAAMRRRQKATVRYAF